jgi:glycosyltransferase involved in cell wall biosynthesis
MWDFTTANRVNYFIANSRFTAARIKRIYNRDADVIYPPVDVEKFSCVSKKDNYFVTASRFAPYKKIDLIVEAFAKMPDKKLVVIGDGPELNKIKSKARSNIELAGYLPHDEMVKYFQNAKAFVFAAEEDFGIVVIQALACGTPVIALNLGGTAETVKHLVTGIHFRKQNVESLIDGVTEFEKNENRFDADAISKYAQSFSVRRFEDEIKKYVEEKANIFFNGNQ